MKCNSGIYSITNTFNGKRYIGSAKNVVLRRNQHFASLRKNCHDNNKLQKSFNKHGENKFVWEVLEFVDDVGLLVDREQFYMDQFKSYFRDSGYNLKPKARNMMGFLHSELTKKNISMSLRNRIISNTHRENLSKATISFMNNNREVALKNIDRTGKSHTEESRAKISMSKKGIQTTGMLGKKHSEFSKAMISLTKIIKKMNLWLVCPNFDVRSWAADGYIPDDKNIL